MTPILPVAPTGPGGAREPVPFSTMRACGTYSPADPATTESEVSRALAQAGLPAGQARAWLSSASGRLHHQAKWSLDYDDELQVASFELWADGRLVFGLDDWLPLP